MSLGMFKNEHVCTSFHCKQMQAVLTAHVLGPLKKLKMINIFVCKHNLLSKDFTKYKISLNNKTKERRPKQLYFRTGRRNDLA